MSGSKDLKSRPTETLSSYLVVTGIHYILTSTFWRAFRVRRTATIAILNNVLFMFLLLLLPFPLAKESNIETMHAAPQPCPSACAGCDLQSDMQLRGFHLGSEHQRVQRVQLVNVRE